MTQAGNNNKRNNIIVNPEDAILFIISAIPRDTSDNVQKAGLLAYDMRASAFPDTCGAAAFSSDIMEVQIKYSYGIAQVSHLFPF